MVVPVSPNLSLPFNKAVLARAESPWVALAKRDPERAQMLQDTQTNLAQALSTARSGKTNIKEQAKAAAREKITRIKEQIKILRMVMSKGADAKAMAQQAARLAKELAAAVKEYARAGGIDMGGGMMVSPISGSQPVAAGDATAEANPETVSDENLSDVDLAFAESQDETADDGTANTDALDQGPVGNPFATDQTDRDRENFALPASNQEDRAFATEVKKMLDELKTILRMQRARMSKDEADHNDDLKDGEKALEDAAKSVQSIMAQAAVPVLNIQT